MNVETETRRQEPPASEPAPSAERLRSYRIRLFAADRTDRAITFEEAPSAELSERQLLWVDAVAPMDEPDATALAGRLDLKAATRASLEEVSSRPQLALHGPYFTLTVATIHTARDREDVWSDYFKPDHLAAFPDLHTKVWNLLKLAGKNKQSVDAQAEPDPEGDDRCGS